jgi:hypothetical protein
VGDQGEDFGSKEIKAEISGDSTGQLRRGAVAERVSEIGDDFPLCKGVPRSVRHTV